MRGLVSFFVLLSLFSFAFGVEELQVFRLIQMEKDSHTYGSMAANINSLTGTSQLGDSLTRNLFITSLETFSISLLDDLLTKDVGAVLILLPEDFSTVDPSTIQRWSAIEHDLLNRNVKIPLYFGQYKSSLFQEIGNTLNPDQFQLDSYQYQFSIFGTEPSVLEKLPITNIEAQLVRNSDASAPIIAFFANYDALTVAPDLSFAADASASSVVSLLQLARMFGKLYRDSKNVGKYNFLFVLTGGMPMEFSGMDRWLSEVDPRILGKIEFAVCLDGLSSGNTLYYHSKKGTKGSPSEKMQQAFQEVAKLMGVDLKVVESTQGTERHMNDLVEEQKLPSTTLSNLGVLSSPLYRTNLFDVSERTDLKILERNTHLIARAIGSYVFGLNPDTNIFEVDSSEESFAREWMTAVANTSRVPGRQGLKDLLVGLERGLGQYASSTSNQTFDLSKEFKLYDRSTSTLLVYKVKPIFFDLVFLALIGLYLFGLLAFLKGPRQFIPWIISIFSTTDKRSLKKKQN